jgi:multidrug resistance efflux pump
MLLTGIAMENENIQSTGSKRTQPELGSATPARSISAPPTGAAAPPRRTAYRRRALLPLVTTGLVLGLWWISGYVLAYTDDAYITSDVVQVTPQVAGPVEGVHVSDNQWVKRGGMLFSIDPTPFKLQLRKAIEQEEEARAQLPVDAAVVESLRAEKDDADAAADLAAINLRRATPLSLTGALSTQEYDTRRTYQEQGVARQHFAEANLQKAIQMLRLQEVVVATAHATRLYADWRLRQTDVTAPVDGQITNLGLVRGDYVSPTQAALAIVDVNAWRVIANYKEYYIRHLPPGRQTWVWLDANPWHFYRARVQGIAHAISRDQEGSSLVPYVSPTVDWIRLDRRIPVRIQLINPPPPQNLFMGSDAWVFAAY